MKLISDFITFNYYCDIVDVKAVRTLEKTLMNIYCLHLKFLLRNVHTILKTKSVNNLFHCLVTRKVKCNTKQLEVTNG